MPENTEYTEYDLGFKAGYDTRTSTNAPCDYEYTKVDKGDIVEVATGKTVSPSMIDFALGYIDGYMRAAKSVRAALRG
jgi:hypothetical protein